MNQFSLPLTKRFRPVKRTALDGKEWWCVFDLEKMKWSTLTCFGKYQTKKACQQAIDHYIDHYNPYHA